jgi:peptide/nickel transport system permease protein
MTVIQPRPSPRKPAQRRERERRERYYSASQWTLIWWRFPPPQGGDGRGHAAADDGLLGLFAEFFAPYGPTERNRSYLYGPPQMPMFCDHNGCSLRPFVHGTRTERDPVTLRSRTMPDPETRVLRPLLRRGPAGACCWA